jgi:hypothetical protein
VRACDPCLSPKVHAIPLEALRRAKHNHIRRQTRELSPNQHHPQKNTKTRNQRTPLPRNTSARCATAISIACALCCCSFVSLKSRLVPICVHSSRPEARASACNASFNSTSHSGLPFVSTYTRESGVVDSSPERTSRTRVTICAISGKQCARYRSSSSGGALPAEPMTGGENRSGRPGNSLKPMKRADQFAMCMQWST